MCGLFGLVRVPNGTPESLTRSSEILVALGIKSEERGRHASGLALVRNLDRRGGYTTPTAEQAKSGATAIDGFVILKDTRRFSELPLAEAANAIGRSAVIIGHTRYATRGAASALENASPLLADSLIGTHNGDVSPTSVPGHTELAPTALGDTDSELIYLALHQARHDRRKMVQVLSALRGRAALAFLDRSRPDRLYLARTALSPLSYATTGDGDLVYASNPDWFRQIEKASTGRLTFTNITLVPEGHLLTVATRTAQIIDVRRFTPTCRQDDLPLINSAVYRAFTREDKAADRALSRHRVARQKLPAWPTLTLAPTIEPAKPARHGTLLWSEESIYSAPLEPVNFDEVESLCWAMGEFDFDTYALIAEASDEDAWDFLLELRAEIKTAFTSGETVNGYVYPTPGEMQTETPDAALTGSAEAELALAMSAETAAIQPVTTA